MTRRMGSFCFLSRLYLCVAAKKISVLTRQEQVVIHDGE